ncbi:hypothetical protein BGZ67_002890 [Mortierella alpina]|nr:hypothetical protein BGZ67_002890 [Mortierella alpina]
MALSKARRLKKIEDTPDQTSLPFIVFRGALVRSTAARPAELGEAPIGWMTEGLDEGLAREDLK